jgi:hypothetical protein
MTTDKRMTAEEWGNEWRGRAKELQVCGNCVRWLPRDKGGCPRPHQDDRFATCERWRFGQ